MSVLRQIATYLTAKLNPIINRANRLSEVLPFPDKANHGGKGFVFQVKQDESGYEWKENRPRLRRVIQEVDSTNRSFGSSWADGKVWGTHTYKAGSKLLLHIYIPCRNDSMRWGGGHLDVQFRLNNGRWLSLGTSGDTLAMGESARIIQAYEITFVLSIGDHSVRWNDFTLQFKFRHKSHHGTFYVNQNTDYSGSSFATHLIIEEIFTS